MVRGQAAYARQERMRLAGVHGLLILVSLVLVMPFVWMISTSFKPSQEVLSPSLNLIPQHPTLDNYREVLGAAPWLRFFANTLLVSGVSTLSVLFTSSLSGYVFAKHRFPGDTLLFLVILATATIPFESYMIPFYLQVRSLGWVNSYPGMVAPLLIMSFGIFFMRQNILSIPDELLDAARIDGASEWRIWARIVVPLTRSAMAALAIFATQAAWAFFIWPLLIINDTRLFTMELGLAMFQKRFTVDYGLVTAGSVVSIAPILIIFMLLRRNIIEGITLTGLKG